MKEFWGFVAGIVVASVIWFGAIYEAPYQHHCAGDELVDEGGNCRHIDTIRSKHLSPGQREAVNEIIDDRLHCITNPNDCY